jgi:hypothetical protein
MKWSDEVRTEILGALLERLPGKKLGACSVCGTIKWNLQPAFVGIIASTDLTLKEGEALHYSNDKVMPCIALTCTNCGNTHFLNLGPLGLSQEDFRAPKEDRPPTLDADPVLLPPDTRK